MINNYKGSNFYETGHFYPEWVAVSYQGLFYYSEQGTVNNEQ